VASTVHFNFKGDDIKSIAKNDSLYCYALKFKSFSISYNNATKDIAAVADEPNTPAQLAFIKEGKALYIVLLNTKEQHEEIRPNLLYSIINK